MKSSTVNLSLSWIESKVLYQGSIELTIAGLTPGGKSVKVKVSLAPQSLGYVANEIHKVVKEQQQTLDWVRKQLAAAEASR